ncbi:hypothetical protein L228DRAFT_261804 [Xylona heveae TC161]|uniref:FHF complex subunit HOOK-interacting protein C-terminal domain-containing protein n=1 Tax=Xylona heveae (strain CBS 132557 / TC161) TaxID=1328760 RepID=A0A165G2A1_XYLHT|nr:hypothetical protein L228DRAFT_261804 [Xylona heveae TC161]KZF21657.1 hypothetical protein L228DRAFT_261804 [Xylona heveae TC161]
MDFWARLIGGGKAQQKRASANDSSQHRLARFKKAYAQLLQLWRLLPASVSADPTVLDNIQINLQRMTNLLQEEARAAAPHLCHSYASASRIYATVPRVVASASDVNISREALLMFTALVESEDEDFISSGEFAQSVMEFVGRVGGPTTVVLNADVESELVEMLFGISAKIRSQPDILPVWFAAGLNGERSTTRNEATIRPSKQHTDGFPLFYLLMDYVHHDGRVGDFARTGLLYIIEAASRSEELEHWIVESDLATLMASGLGALYSQLSRKLILSYSKEEPPAILALSDFSKPSTILGAEFSMSASFQMHMDTFLSYLVFWQDVLEHCSSAEINQTLLDHFQVLFLQQLLYPSLLESSDIDGGSVAVLTYLRRILDSLDNPDLVQLILRYLLALPENLPTSTPPGRPTLAARQASIDALTHLAHLEDKTTPSLFNLVDLILESIQSKNSQTVATTLNLVSVILRKHHQYAVSTLVQTSVVPSGSPLRTLGGHEKEMSIFFQMVEDIGYDDNLDISYQNHLKDNLNILESHPCSAPRLALKDNGDLNARQESILASIPKDSRPHALRLEDPLLKQILQLFTTFYANDVETNLSLTEVIVNLASCSHLRMDGWLLVDPLHYIFPDSPEDETAPDAGDLSPDSTVEDQLGAMHLASRQPTWAADHSPPVLAILQSLVEQLKIHRQEISHFDIHLSERKRAFQVSDELTEALSSIPSPPRPKPTSPSSPSPSTSFRPESPTPTTTTASSRGFTPVGTKRVPTIETISQRMRSDEALSLSRSNSPRGRPRIVGSSVLPSPSPASGRQVPAAPVAAHQSSLMGSPSLSAPRRPRDFSPSPLRDTLLSPSSAQHHSHHPRDRDRDRGRPHPPSQGQGQGQDIKRDPGLGPVSSSSMSPRSSHSFSSSSTAFDQSLLKRTIKVPGHQPASSSSEFSPSSSPSKVETEAQADIDTEPSLSSLPQTSTPLVEITLNHFLTNVVILQEFILELAALVQVRTSLFDDEIRFM